MASFNGPKLTNPIRTDVPDTQEVLVALAKQDPTSISDIPADVKRLYEVSGGKWQWQEYNGSSWAPVPFLQHNVDQLDGYHAAITPASNTVAVRNASGVLEDSITGNAATASSAATLSQTLPVNKGGTGATTSEAARANLGVSPTSHASTNTTHGVGNATQYGHLKLSDATNNLSGVSGGVAATPAAVKVAKDAADAAQSSANNAMTKASTLATASAAGIVKPGTGMTVDAAGALNVNTASTSKAGIVQLNDTVTSTSKTQGATANAVKMAYDKAVMAEAALPAGFVIAFAANSAPSGYLLCNGAAVSRTTYAALFAVIGTSYGPGDGATTFHIPDLLGRVIQGTGGDHFYIEAGLPNIIGSAGNLLWNTHVPPSANGSFLYDGMGNGQWVYIGHGDFWSGSAMLLLNASLSSSIYGNSSTVQPPALAMRYYIRY